MADTKTPSRRSVVALVRCLSYDPAEVNGAIRRGIDLLGGCSRFVKPGERILFKPNILWGTDPAKCVVTHPEVLSASINAFATEGAILEYGDSPAGLQQTAGAIKKCGYDRLISTDTATATPLDTGEDVQFPDGIAGKRLHIAQAVLKADGVINLPKLKTHGLTRMTGAIKNLFGCIPGMTKGQYHARFPDVYDFSCLLADIASFVHARLHILDAVEAMEGNGPQSGTPKKLGVILLSTDPVSLDTVACRLIDLDPRFVPTIAAGIKNGLGIGQSDAIDIIGDPVEECIDRNFKVVKSAPPHLPPTTTLGNIKRHFLPRPVIRSNLCTSCGRCVSVCPVTPRAINKPSDAKQPVYDYSRCIRCYCCQEVCPSKAIFIKHPIAARLLPFATYLSLAITRRNSALPDGPH